MTGILEKLFGSSARVKIIRYFLLNPESIFDVRGISRRVKASLMSTRREISLLKDIGFIKQKSERIDEIIKLKNGKIKNKKKRIQGLKLNPLFSFNEPLKKLLADTVPIDREKISKALCSAGKIKLVALSGIFTQPNESGTDLLLVGDSVRRAILERVLKNIEAEMGRELVYALFSTEEFLYRFEMYDRFVHDILSYPHLKLVNKINI